MGCRASAPKPVDKRPNVSPADAIRRFYSSSDSIVDRTGRNPVPHELEDDIIRACARRLRPRVVSAEAVLRSPEEARRALGALSSALKRTAPHPRWKALVIIKHVCLAGQSDLKRSLQRDSALVRACQSGCPRRPRHPRRADAPRRACEQCTRARRTRCAVTSTTRACATPPA